MAHLNEYLASLDADITGQEAVLETFQSAVDVRKEGTAGTHARRQGSSTLDLLRDTTLAQNMVVKTRYQFHITQALEINLIILPL